MVKSPEPWRFLMVSYYLLVFFLTVKSLGNRG